MTAPYREPNPEPGDILRDLEWGAQRPSVWPWRFDLEPTTAEDMTPLRALMDDHQPRAARPQRRGDPRRSLAPRRLVGYIDPALRAPIGSSHARTVTRRVVKTGWRHELAVTFCTAVILLCLVGWAVAGLTIAYLVVRWLAGVVA